MLLPAIFHHEAYRSTLMELRKESQLHSSYHQAMAYHYFDEKSKLNSFLTLFFILLLFINPSSVFSKSPRPITDVEIRQIKNECYADIER
uniref:Uncharacterized protein n=1 Tax=Salix viminalis TaxID=40686 RepID=A0A6N2LEC2_SALVM